jgi:DNA polymerase
METIYIDFETYYDKEFSLSQMQTDAYVLDERFETIMVCVKREGRDPDVIYGTDSQINEQLQSYCDWSQVAICCHNTMFDGFILTQRYGIKPRLWKCTQAMSRMVKPDLKSHSLKNMAMHYGLQDKGDAVHNMIGKRAADMNDKEFEEYITYCEGDVCITEGLHNKLIDRAPTLNLLLIDMTIRMFTEPTFVGDLDMMKQLHTDEVLRKEGLLAMAQVDRSEIMSNAKFAERLRNLGVIPPTKISPKTGKTAFAFAKTDKEFLELLDHPDSEVQALVAARVGAKTTIAETRAARFVDMAERGPLPVYLNYWGAKTTGRLSGGNKVNWQNLPSRGPSAGLRKALKAPKGHVVLVGDSSNIELRTVMALAGCGDALKKISHGVDMYCDFATSIFNRPISKDDKAERFLGKTAMLGLQYGAGAPRFHEMVRAQSRHIAGAEPISIDKAYEVVDIYRSVYHEIKMLWDSCQHKTLLQIKNDDWMEPVDVNGWFITQFNGFGRPGEPGVVYKDLRYDGEDRGWVYTMGRNNSVRIFGPKVVENLCQHAAMQIVMWQAAKIHQRYPVKLTVHDEVVCIVPETEADEAKRYMEQCLRDTPKWCRGAIPVDCEVEIGLSYGDAK